MTPNGVKPTAPAQSPGAQLGFGSSIQNARLARAAQMALQSGNHGAALSYAERAAHAAPSDPSLQFLVGYAARLAGRYGESVAAYERGLKLAPGNLEGLSGLAQSYLAMGMTAQAQKLLTEVVAKNPSQPDDLLALGTLYLNEGQNDQAVEWLNRAERVRPDARSELLLALAYERTHQMGPAARYLALAQSKAPNNPDVERSLAGFYREQGDYGKAVASLLAIHNPPPDVVAELAYTYKLAGNVQQSVRYYAQAAAARPQDLNLQISAAEAELAAGSTTGAIRYLNQAGRIDPASYRLHDLRGQIAQMENRNAEAIREYTEALAHLPASPAEGPLYGIQLHMTLFALYADMGEPEQAHTQLQAAAQAIAPLDIQGPERASFLRLRALVRFNSGELVLALADMEASLALTPHDINSLLIEGDLLIKLDRTAQGIAVYKQALALNPRNRFALTSLGYASRLAGDDRQAEVYFRQLARDYPDLYLPHLALGDIYTSQHDYRRAVEAYTEAGRLAPDNALVVAGAMNAALELHDLPLAGRWVSRVTPAMEFTPTVLREEERYYYFTGRYQRSADLGERAIRLLPRDREVVVYLGYDLLNLERYSELQALTEKYAGSFPKDPDIPLLAGYVYKHDGDREKALAAFEEALRRDPTVTTALVNKGFILNDLGRAQEAQTAFEQALSQEPNNGQAHLGLAFAELNLEQPGRAIEQSRLAEKELGDSEAVHLIRATAYGRQGYLNRAAAEYQDALRFDPRDGSLYLGLANVQFAQRQYHEALDSLHKAQNLLPRNAETYAMAARIDADLGNREQTMVDIGLAEQYAVDMPVTRSEAGAETGPSDIFVSTGEALSTLGDQKAALGRFSHALALAGRNRVNVRLAIARLMVQQQRYPEAERQIALAQMESEAGDTAAVTPNQDIEISSIFQQMHDYDLSQTYLKRADVGGASSDVVHIARANNYLALGDTARAAAELDAVRRSAGGESNYAYLLAEANLYEQQHRSTQAISAFAQAASDAGEDQTAEQALLRAGASEGYPLNQHVSLLDNVILQPIFEDSTDYVLDSKLDSPTPVEPTDLAQLPPPRSSEEADEIAAYHLHLGNLPTMGGFFQLRDTRGTVSIPENKQGLIRRNTVDTVLNFGIAPTLHAGTNAVTLNTGIQETIRRDTESPTLINQNLFRVFSYGSTTSFFDAVSASGYIVYERGPFTEEALHSSTLAGAFDFRVGAPWSKTALVTGWGATDQKFNSPVQCSGNIYPCGFTQNYFTSSYIGLSHTFGSKLTGEALIEDLRSWRTVPFYDRTSGAIAQVLRPAGTIDFTPTPDWEIEANTSFEDTRGFHVYDMTQNGVAISWTRHLGRSMNEDTGKVHIRYPIRFSLGVQEETFPNFSRGPSTQLRPYFSLNLF